MTGFIVRGQHITFQKSHRPQTTWAILDPMPRSHLDQLRSTVREALLSGLGLAALPKCAPGKGAGQVWGLPGNRKEILPLRLQRRDGTLERPSVGMSGLSKDRLHRG